VEWNCSCRSACRKFPSTPYLSLVLEQHRIHGARRRRASGQLRPARHISTSVAAGKSTTTGRSSTKFRYGTGTPYTPFLADGQRDYVNFNGDRLPDFHSARPACRQPLEFHRLEPDHLHRPAEHLQPQEQSRPTAGTRATRRVEAAGGTIGLLPTIGVSAEF
jgi:hypothetical protein